MADIIKRQTCFLNGRSLARFPFSWDRLEDKKQDIQKTIWRINVHTPKNRGRDGLVVDCFLPIEQEKTKTTWFLNFHLEKVFLGFLFLSVWTISQPISKHIIAKIPANTIESSKFLLQLYRFWLFYIFTKHSSSSTPILFLFYIPICYYFSSCFTVFLSQTPDSKPCTVSGNYKHSKPSAKFKSWGKVNKRILHQLL